MLAQKCNQRPVSAPDYVFNRWRRNFGECLLLLNVIEDNRRGGAQDETSSATVEDFVCRHGRLDGLNDGVGHVAYFDQL